MTKINNTQSFTNWAFSDYQNDKNYQPFFSCSGASLRGRLISLADIPSQAIRGTASIIGGILSSLLYVLDGLNKRKLKYFSAAILTFTAGNLWVVATKIFVIVGDILGIFAPQMGRQARTLVRVFNAAIEMEFRRSYNLPEPYHLLGADLSHTPIPQPASVGWIASEFIWKVCQAESHEREELYDRLNGTIQEIFENYKDKTGIACMDNVWGDEYLRYNVLNITS
jgi:hypothetical protein